MAVKGKIGVVGSGLIGRSWAMLFASANYQVALYDSDNGVTEKALLDIEQQLKELESSGLLRGSLSAEEQLSLISGCNSLEECVRGAIHVQESVYEDAEVKKCVFMNMDSLVSKDTTLCSSTSCIMPSTLSDGLTCRSRVIVAHPANPPYFVPIVEVVPSRWTDQDVVEKTISLMREIGQKPVLVKKEMYGFAINRMQYAILNECWRLIQDGVVTVDEVDAVMPDGLGMRFSFLGVFEARHLNAHGFLDNCTRKGRGIYNVTQTFGPVPKMEGPLAQHIHEELCKRVPLEKIPERRRWRDRCLASLAKLKQSLEREDRREDA